MRVAVEVFVVVGVVDQCGCSGLLVLLLSPLSLPPSSYLPSHLYVSFTESPSLSVLRLWLASPPLVAVVV